MNLRKYFFIISSVVLLFLFSSGLFVLFNLNQDNKIAAYNNPVSNVFSQFVTDRNPFNILFMVKEQSGSNTDTMLLINVNPITLKVNVMSIPRDTYCEFSKEKSISKINSAYGIGGASGVIDEVSNLLNVRIKYYIHIDIKTFRQVIDILDGVEFDIPTDLDYVDPTQDLQIHLKKGKQLLNGENAEKLLRFRQTQNKKYKGEISKYYDGSDLKREEMQRKFIKALFDQKVSIRYLPKICEIVKTVFNNIKTNIPLSDALNYSNIIINVKANEINWVKLPGSPKRLKYWYFIIDKNETAKISAEYFAA